MENKILIPITPDQLDKVGSARNKEIVLSRGQTMQRIDFENLANEIGLNANQFDFKTITLADAKPTKQGFYFPTEKGTYTNFGNIEITEADVNSTFTFIVYDLKNFVKSTKTLGIGEAFGVAPLDAEKKIPNENLNFGEVKEGDSNVVSGGEVFDILRDEVGIVEYSSVENYIASLYGISREGDNDTWGEGYIGINGNALKSNTYLYTKEYIPLAKGIYKTNLSFDGDTAVMAIYDGNKAFKEYYGTNGNSVATLFWEFELKEDGYIRFSYAKYYDANPEIVKLEGRSISSLSSNFIATDKVFALKDKMGEYIGDFLDIHSIEKGTNFVQELVGSDIKDTSLWLPRYINENGGTSNADRFYHTVKTYEIPKGKYEYRLFFSGNAKGLLYDANTLNLEIVLSNDGDGQVKTIEVEKDMLLRFSHRIAIDGTSRTDLIYFKNTEEIYPTIITSENIGNYSSYDSYRQILKDTYKPRKKRKIVSFISDDGYASEFDWFCPLLEEYDIRATLAIVKNWVGNQDVGKMLTKEQIRELDSRGHEIASHTTTHERMNEVADDHLHEMIGGNKLYLETLLNKPCPTFISPFGIRSGKIDSVVAAYHNCNVISGYGHLNNPPINSYALNRVSFDLATGQNSRFPDILKPIIDDSAENNNWLVFAFHTARGEYKNRQQELRNMIEYLLSKGYEFATVRDAMTYMHNPIEIGVKDFDFKYYKLGMDGSEENVSYFKE